MIAAMKSLGALTVRLLVGLGILIGVVGGAANIAHAEETPAIVLGAGDPSVSPGGSTQLQGAGWNGEGSDVLVELCYASNPVNCVGTITTITVNAYGTFFATISFASLDVSYCDGDQCVVKASQDGLTATAPVTFVTVPPQPSFDPTVSINPSTISPDAAVTVTGGDWDPDGPDVGIQVCRDADDVCGPTLNLLAPDAYGDISGTVSLPGIVDGQACAPDLCYVRANQFKLNATTDVTFTSTCRDGLEAKVVDHRVGTKIVQFVECVVKKVIEGVRKLVRPTPTKPVVTKKPVVHKPATSYTVQPGDTLSGIAKKLLGSVGKYPTIAKANGIKAPYLINPGQVLLIPAA